MAFRVVLAKSAEAEAEALYQHVVEAAPHRGPLWFQDLMDHLSSLDSRPLRCPLAREAARSGRQIRCLLFGRRPDVYRILFEVDQRRKLVSILHIRHGARKDLVAV